jgi:hypothetical protein
MNWLAKLLWFAAPLLSLGDAVTVLADHPTVANQERFFRLFLKERVGLMMVGQTGLKPGPQVTTRPLTALSALAPDGTRAVVVFCDIPRLHAAHPDRQYAEMEPRDVLKMARDQKRGVLVYNGLDGRDSFGYISPSDVDRLLQRPK